jgi:hypothetical protein
MYSKVILSSAAASLLASTAAAQSLNGTSGYINYTTVTGYFLQDISTTNASTFDYVSAVLLSYDQSGIDGRLRLPRTSASSIVPILRRMASLPT